MLLEVVAVVDAIVTMGVIDGDVVETVVQTHIEIVVVNDAVAHVALALVVGFRLGMAVAYCLPLK